jgi:hypothetical protein
MAERASAIKRRYGSVVGPSAWYRQFRELVSTASIYHLKRALKEWSLRSLWIQQGILAGQSVVVDCRPTSFGDEIGRKADARR